MALGASIAHVCKATPEPTAKATFSRYYAICMGVLKNAVTSDVRHLQEFCQETGIQNVIK